LESSSYSDNELDIYDRYWDSVRTQRTLYTGAIDEGRAEGRAKGRAEGLVEGRAEGIAEGEAIGMEKGKADGRAEMLWEIVLKAHRSGMSLPEIAKFVELPEEEVGKMLHS
jgi:predicted transposase YdaD